MEKSVFEHMGQQMDDTTHKATRTVSAIADALEDGADAARRAVRDGSDAASEFLYDARRRLQRRPIDSLALTLAAGVAAGALIGWMLKRGKQLNQNS
jgi:hypothetical protein